MSGTIQLPTILTQDGLQPTSPATIQANLIASVAATNPGYTILPGGLIEDINSTQVAGIAQCDQAVVETVNSITPYGANAFLLNQLGQIYGVPQGVDTNGSAYVQFTGTPGFPIPVGFTVSDGTNQYTVQAADVVQTGGQSDLVYVLATQAGVFPIPANTITLIATSLPPSIALTVTNPQSGIPQQAAQTESDYRSQVLQAGLASAQGMPRFLKTLLLNVPGVAARLVSVQQQSSGGWKILCGGGDPFAVGNAIFNALFDVSSLVGSGTASRNITVSIADYPDTYQIVYVSPPGQGVTISLTWNTSQTGLAPVASVAQLANPALVNYVNSLPVGQPMNIFEMQNVFQTAVVSVILPQFITRIVFGVTINGTSVSPASGTGIISGDSEAYFATTPAQVTIQQG